jgi:hypothetical protein
MSALISGMAGIMVASYGNEVWVNANFFINLCLDGNEQILNFERAQKSIDKVD